ncbi:MAG TPA: hypothetical protein VIN59_08705 [Alphaproteobacteria bacterium]
MRRKFRLLASFRIVRLILSAVGAFSLMFSSGLAISPAQASSPLLAQSKASQLYILRLMELIRSAAGGHITEANAAQSVANAIKAAPGASLTMVASAINQFHFAPNVAKAAMEGATKALNVTETAMINALVADTYMNAGTQAAKNQIGQMRSLFGPDKIVAAMDDKAIAGLMHTEDLNAIQPAAGHGLYDG